MAVATDAALALACVLAAALPARADAVTADEAPLPFLDVPRPPPPDAAILGRDEGWRVEDLRLRFSVLDQHGHGYQSEAGPLTGPGSEQATIWEPWALARIRQSRAVVHEVTFPIDVISAASPDALDAISTASRTNEAAAVDVRTSIRRSEVTTLSTRASLHWEEPLSALTLGAGWRRGLADDNAAIAVSGTATVDGFDVRDQHGKYLGKNARETAGVNLTASQLLSPTTVAEASYGATYQHGVLAQAWNAVPVALQGPAEELLPDHRLRHALSARLAQHVPQTGSTVKAWYRYYVDDFGLRAHTVELAAYQYVVPWLYVRGSYRYHHQTGVDFFTTGLPAAPLASTPRTSDSDLAPLHAHEWGVELVLVEGRAPSWLRRWAVSAEVMRYLRSNDLWINVVSLAIGRRL